MTQSIDHVRLRAAAEHLEWVLAQYPGPHGAEGLRESFATLIEQAKAGLIKEPQGRSDSPARYALAERVYADLENPSVEEALVAFAVELRGGLTERERRIIERMR